MIPLKKRYTPPVSPKPPQAFSKEPEITLEALKNNTVFVQICVEEHHHHLHAKSSSYNYCYTSLNQQSVSQLASSPAPSMKPISAQALSALAKTPVVVELTAGTNYPIIPQRMENTAPILPDNAVATAAAIAAAATAPFHASPRRFSSNSTIL
eukprot:3431140-Ditylum_brightwellii.AAC.1